MSWCLFCCYLQPRVALVIGNGAYGGDFHLPSAVQSATAVAEALRSAGFSVILATDVDRAHLRAAIHAFTASLVPGCTQATTAVVYFCGHGWQTEGGPCFMVPVDFAGVNPEGMLFKFTQEFTTQGAQCAR